MFTQPLSQPPPAGPQTLAPPVPVSAPPSRHSRLRGLSYLRTVTQNHLLSRDNHHGTSSPTSPQSAAVTSNTFHFFGNNNSSHSNGSGNSGDAANSNGNGNSTPSSNANGRPGVARSASYSPLTTSTSAAPAQPQSQSRGFRLSVITSSADPSRNNTSGPSSAQPDPHTGNPSGELPLGFTTTVSAGPSATAEHAPELPLPSDSAAAMARARASSVPAEQASGASSGPSSSDNAPSLRLSAYYDPRSTRPSLSFSPISRTLPNGNEVIRVGRYSEREGQAAANVTGNQPSAAPVGFKSKVVSRRHCEFWYEQGKWHIRDVKSSSGTFLNHIRLSPPSQESKAFPINDGDIIQLGIDFKGGEEMIFRCVKMRVELNRGWQNKLNTFNMAAHKRLRNMASNNATGGAGAGSSSQDCSICLNSIAPCQSLFVAPCSHTWHFKCIRALLLSPQYPIFVCPNCRAGADLEADVDEPSEGWDQLEDEVEEQPPATEALASYNAIDSNVTRDDDDAALERDFAQLHEGDTMDLTVAVNGVGADEPSPRTTSHPLPPATDSRPITIPIPNGRSSLSAQSPSPPPVIGAEGPITPRNDAGPWVFDGLGGRRTTMDATQDMASLAAAAEMGVRGDEPPLPR